MESIVKRLRREREQVERMEKFLFEQLNTSGLQFDALIQRTDGWYNARNRRLTASNFGTICELSPYATARSLWHLMAGLIEDQRNLNNDVHVNRETGFYLLPAPHEYLGASPDALIDDGKGLVEIKCPAHGHFERIPDDYMAQIQGQLAICSRQYCDFCSFHTNYGIRIWRVQASSDYWKWMLPQLESFYEQLRSGTVPPTRFEKRTWTRPPSVNIESIGTFLVS